MGHKQLDFFIFYVNPAYMNLCALGKWKVQMMHSTITIKQINIDKVIELRIGKEWKWHFPFFSFLYLSTHDFLTNPKLKFHNTDSSRSHFYTDMYYFNQMEVIEKLFRAEIDLFLRLQSDTSVMSSAQFCPPNPLNQQLFTVGNKLDELVQLTKPNQCISLL